jgi:hypothetical protein
MYKHRRLVDHALDDLAQADGSWHAQCFWRIRRRRYAGPGDPLCR